MTYIISNDPIWWPLISYSHFSGYFAVAFAVVVGYDWVLTFAQEFELIWRQRWSFMTVLYISVRYIGILYAFSSTLWFLPISMTDVGCNIIYFMWRWTPVVVNAMLGVIMMTRIHAMYGRSNKMLVFLSVFLLVSTIATGVVTVIGNLGVSGGEGVFSGYHVCFYDGNTGTEAMNNDMIIPTTIWEILVFFLAVRIIIKHLRELRQSQRRLTIRDCFMVLIKSHALYFLAFAVVACMNLGSLSPKITYPTTLGVFLYDGFFTIALGFQMCVLGPRLILGVRQYHTKLVAGSDEGTYMTPIAFQDGGDTLTDGDV